MSYSNSGAYQSSSQHSRYTQQQQQQQQLHHHHHHHPPPSHSHRQQHPSQTHHTQQQQQQQQQQQRPQHQQPSSPAPLLTDSPNFDILDWHPAYESCQRYFLDHAQHEPGTQALCALVNIRLPFQWLANPMHSSAQPPYQPAGPSPTYNFNSSSSSNSNYRAPQPPAYVSLIPYIRRLVITGFDKPGILHGFFGDAYHVGVSPLQECERRNYLFAAKHGGWRTCKKQYDMNAEETVPFLKPLQSVRDEELDAAEKSWSSWLAMEDWMIGPRAPPGGGDVDEEMSGAQGRGGGGGGGGASLDGSAPGPWARGSAGLGFDTGLSDSLSDGR